MPKAPKRRIKTLVWGNIYGYLGARNVHCFGLDKLGAQEWLERGEWYGFDGLKGVDLLYSVTEKGELVRREISEAQAVEWEAGKL